MKDNKKITIKRYEELKEVAEEEVRKDFRNKRLNFPPVNDVDCILVNMIIENRATILALTEIIGVQT